MGHCPFLRGSIDKGSTAGIKITPLLRKKNLVYQLETEESSLFEVNGRRP